MKYFALLNLVLHLAYSQSGSYHDFAFDKCSIKKKSCEIHEDNLIESFAVADLEECLQRCGGLENCQYFSYFGADNFPFSNRCILFSNCSILNDCGDDCYTEDQLCHGSCGRIYESKQDENVIKLVPDVKLERNCKNICLANDDCLYYTYYSRESDYNPNLCILLSELLETDQECKHCVTSVPNCKTISNLACKFTLNSYETLHESYLFKKVGSTSKVTFSIPPRHECKLTVIAIGGGGGSDEGVGGGGCGSGFVQSVVIDISSSKWGTENQVRQYQVSVGNYGHESFVKSMYDGHRVISAQPGGISVNGFHVHGGSGYSGGGGGHPIGGGGSDGSKGEGSYGGIGSGFNISTISLEYHILSPGYGGCHEIYGGGGGGVLVDNVGPNPDAFRENGQGEGYGGGGSGYYGIGLQGTVLIEAKLKTKDITP